MPRHIPSLLLAAVLLILAGGCAGLGDVPEGGVEALPAMGFAARPARTGVPSPTPRPSPRAPAAPSPTPAVAQGAQQRPTRPPAPEEGAAAADFTLETLDGTTISLQGLRGTPVMVTFWASWCGPCRVEIPHMVALYGESAERGFEILAVNMGDSPGQAQEFAEEMGMTFPVLLDRHGEVAYAYHVHGIPTSVFVDAEGIIRHVHVGTLSAADLQYYFGDLMD